MSAIVTNAKNRIAYTIVRNLSDNGINVYTADFVPLSMSFASRFAKGYFTYPSPFRDQDAFIECIIDNVRRLKADVLIPVFEETFLLSKYKDAVAPYVAMAIPDYDQILTAHNKDRWMPVARSLGIPIPRTVPVSELKASGIEKTGLHFPVLIKPNQGGGAWGISYVETAGELGSILSEDRYCERTWDRFSVQEKIMGHVHCVAMLFNRGEMKGHVVYRQLRDLPYTGGQATLRVSVQDTLAVDYFRTLLEHLSWHGICQADFLVDDDTGIPYLIDINPRFWGSLIQGIASGVDFPYMLYRIARDGDTPAVDNYRKNVVTRWVWGDLRTLPQAYRGAPDKIAFIKDYLRLFGKEVLFDDLCLKDPLPFITSVCSFLIISSTSV